MRADAVQCPERRAGTVGDDEIPRRATSRAWATRSTPHRAPCRGHASFPTGPVSADAVLLTSLGVESGHGNDGLPRRLIAAVVGDLVRRGVRALEAFGHTAEVTELLDPRMVPPDLRPAVEVLGDCSVDQCVLDVDLLQDAGFVVVAPAPVLPAAAAGAGAGTGLEGRRRSGIGAAAGNRPTAAAGRRRDQAPVTDRSGQVGLTRPACSTDSSWASSSANVNVPVGRSFLPSRYSRLTAARMPSAIESRVWVDTSMARSRGLVM